MISLCKKTAVRFAAGAAVMALVLLTAGAARAAFVTIDAPSSTGPGSTIEFTVTLTSEGDAVSSLATDIGFPPASPVDSLEGSPACVLNPAVIKPQSGFRYRPGSCTVGTDCDAIRAGIVSLEDATAKEPIPDGAVYTCSLTVAADAAGTIDLTVVSATATDPDNADTDITDASQGASIAIVEPSAFVTIGTVSGVPGQTVEFPVSLTNVDGSLVSSLAVDFGFPAESPVDSNEGSPACVLDPTVNKPQSGFRFRPSNCVHGTDCDEIRAGIVSLEDATAKEPIPDGVVFSCFLTIPVGMATDTTIPLTISSVTATDPDNNDTDITGNSQGGAVEVTDEPQDTPTPTAPAVTDTPTQGAVTETPTAPAATATPTPTEVGPDTMLINVGSVVGLAGTDQQPVDITLFAGSNLQVAGTQNDTGFQDAARISANPSGRPDCAANPDINKGGTSFAFQPPMCTPGDNCTGIRAFVLALDNTDAIPTGSVLYTCNTEIAEGANDAFPLTCTNSGGSDPVGGAIPSECEDGCIDVPELVAATVAGGESISTGDSTSDIDPTETTLTSPGGGLVSILEEGRCPGTGETPDNFNFVGLKVTTRAPVGSPANPVILKFLLDESQFTGEEEAFFILKDGDPFRDGCIADGIVDPDPCINDIDSGDLTAEVLATDANAVWEFAVLQPTPTPTEVPTATETPEPTDTPITPGAPTNTPIELPTASFNEDDGCQVVAPSDTNMAWLLLLPAALLVRRRRDSR